MGFLSTVSIVSIKIIDGRMNLSDPKILRHNREMQIPVNAGIWFLLDFHCSTNITTNNAVITKSMPLVLKENTDPAIPPIAEPVTQ